MSKQPVNINFSEFFSNVFHSLLFAVSVALLISFLIFWISWRKEPRRLINGILFTFSGMIFVIWFGALIEALNNSILIKSSVLVLFLFVVIIGLLTAFGWILFLWNAAVVWRHESHSLANMLTMLVGIGLIVLWFINLFNWQKILPDWLNILISSAPVIGTYLGVVMYNFLLNSFLYQFVPKKYPQNYLIVLGAGLINGDQVSRLLANRIDRALTYYNKQIEKGLPAPKIIFSGGQGPDEKLSEARAMADYAIKKGLPKKQILLEDNSKTTLENMRFSKIVATNDFGNDNFKAKFFSNNYHIFRAGLFAKQAGLNANGVGAKTRLYFLPNAVIREFAAVFVMNKKRHFIIIGGIAIWFAISSLISVLIN